MEKDKPEKGKPKEDLEEVNEGLKGEELSRDSLPTNYWHFCSTAVIDQSQYEKLSMWCGGIVLPVNDCEYEVLSAVLDSVVELTSHELWSEIQSWWKWKEMIRETY